MSDNDGEPICAHKNREQVFYFKGLVELELIEIHGVEYCPTHGLVDKASGQKLVYDPFNVGPVEG